MPESPMLVFAPLHKRAFGIAAGTVSAVVIFVMTAIYLLRGPHPGIDLDLLSQYFAGYSTSWPGAFIGAAWAGFAGFVAGWFLAFARNFLLAAYLFAARTRAELTESRDFLDHI